MMKTELITVSLLKEMGRLRTQILAKFSSFRKFYYGLKCAISSFATPWVTFKKEGRIDATKAPGRPGPSSRTLQISGGKQTFVTRRENAEDFGQHGTHIFTDSWRVFAPME
ncbi:hypothetical protein DERP_001657 [Dermatophagoides pteronyssinus]|uniref:Uncharacterized protein n=1 Tax=Dermatophagoides pteronyssinus TaxID=6956 RepID=A0ABQ8JB52_DERPT|nr:hypothetical protein DERP_001657 [Dermatophagoides pteronyssinus]